jgi:hypothetical protein
VGILIDQNQGFQNFPKKICKFFNDYLRNIEYWMTAEKIDSPNISILIDNRDEVSILLSESLVKSKKTIVAFG